MLIAAVLLAADVHGQGALTPPGAPGPVMKSLDQIEPRTIVNATNTPGNATNTPGNATNTYIISLSGSYYLTSNLVGDAGKHGISIQADDVTLDLNGFALATITPASGVVRGIDVPAVQKNLCLRNGTVRGWNGGGVRADLAANTFLEKLRLSDNAGAAGLAMGSGSARECVAIANATGSLLNNGAEISDCAATGNVTGFSTQDRTMLTSCIATENSGSGFQCGSCVTLVDCTASRNFGAAGITTGGGCSILRCNSSRNITLGAGIVTGTGSTVVDCTASNNALGGIVADAGSTVRNCTVTANGHDGILVTSECLVTGNNCRLNSIVPDDIGAGIRATGNGNRIDGNTCSSNSTDYGIYVADGTSRNTVVRNVSTGHLKLEFSSQNYRVGGAGNFAAVVSGYPELESASPWANIGD